MDSGAAQSWEKLNWPTTRPHGGDRPRSFCRRCGHTEELGLRPRPVARVVSSCLSCLSFATTATLATQSASRPRGSLAHSSCLHFQCRRPPRPVVRRGDKPRVVNLAPNPPSTRLRKNTTTTDHHQLQRGRPIVIIQHESRIAPKARL
jgi:hypothetical protein